MQLMINGVPVVIGETYTTFKEETVTLLGVTEPHKPSSTGRVYLEFENGWRQECFPSVIRAKWIGRTDGGYPNGELRPVS